MHVSILHRVLTEALIPDVVPQEQHSLATNSYISLAIGFRFSCCCSYRTCFENSFSLSNVYTSAQFIMAALAFTLAMTWTCLTIHEKHIEF